MNSNIPNNLKQYGGLFNDDHHYGSWQYRYRNYFHSTTSCNNSTSSNSKSSSNNNSIYPQQQHNQQQPFVPMSKEEEVAENTRVSQLSIEQKDIELRQLNRQIAILEMKRGINTGELYTWTGKYKTLARDYSTPLFVWYTTVWLCTGVLFYTTFTIFDIDFMYVIQQFDHYTGFHMSQQINPEYGKIGVILVMNEIIEPIRLPIVILTVKPVIDALYPTKY
jgi:hypothetical protein